MRKFFIFIALGVVLTVSVSGRETYERQGVDIDSEIDAIANERQKRDAGDDDDDCLCSDDDICDCENDACIPDECFDKRELDPEFLGDDDAALEDALGPDGSPQKKFFFFRFRRSRRRRFGRRLRHRIRLGKK